MIVRLGGRGALRLGLPSRQACRPRPAPPSWIALWTPPLEASTAGLSSTAGAPSAPEGAQAEPDVDAMRRLANLVLTDQALAKEIASRPGMSEILSGYAAAPGGKDDDSASSSLDDVPMPSFQQLRLYSMTHFIPFVGFGFLDNAIMILAGDFIDFKLGAAFGITTMAAAAIGNTISDVVGIWGSGFIEHMASLLGLPDHGITNVQEKKFNVRIVKNSAMISGIVVGCVIGMFPLVYPEEWRLWPTRERLEAVAIATFNARDLEDPAAGGFD